MRCSLVVTLPCRVAQRRSLATTARERLTALAPTISQLEASGKLVDARSSSSTSTTGLTIQRLMDAGLHLGHSVDLWHKHMLPFIYGRRSGVHLVNLEHTLTHLRRAANVTRQVAARGGVILFVGHRPFLLDIVANAARHSGQFYVHGAWLEGCMVNHGRTLHAAAAGAGEQMGGVAPRHGNVSSAGAATTATRATPLVLQPDLVVVLDMNECQPCLNEVARVNVPTIGLCDTDCNPAQVTYAVPGNDDAVASVELVASVLAQAAREGRSERRKLQRERRP